MRKCLTFKITPQLRLTKKKKKKQRMYLQHFLQQVTFGPEHRIRKLHSVKCLTKH